MYAPAEKPYQDLYIYYLEGTFDSHTNFPREHFIGNWEEEGSSFLFFGKPAENAVRRLVASQSGVTFVDQYQMRYNQWLGEEPKPVRIGSFTVTPPWYNDAKQGMENPAKLQIVLDPGVVFGTGTHPTTHDCIVALEKACSFGNIETAMDLGTGTGLLAVAAAKLGCTKVLAADINFLAARTARKNIQLNGLASLIVPVQGSALDLIENPADLLIANIHYDVMKQLIASNGFLTKGYFILSGLLRSQARDVENQLAQLPVCLIEKWDVNGIWHTYLGKTGSH